MPPMTLTIGQLAQRFGLKTSAIRYYERVAVLPEPDREHGQRSTLHITYVNRTKSRG